MDVVRVVAERIQPLRAALRDVVLIGLGGHLVRLHHVGMTADPHVDVRRHVDDVSGAGHQRQQPIGFGFRAFRRVGRLPQVDPVVQRAGMIRVLRQHLLERRLDLASSPRTATPSRVQ